MQNPEIASTIGSGVLAIGFAFSVYQVLQLAKFISLGPNVRQVSNSVNGDKVPPVMEPFIEAVSSARKNVRIFAAELDLRLFNFSEVLDAFDTALKNGAEIEIICGPLFLVNSSGDLKGKNPLWERFKKRDRFKFYLRTTRRNINHGTIVDDGRFLIVEDYHAPAAPERFNYVYEKQQSTPGAEAWIRRFEDTKNDPTTTELSEEEFNERCIEFDNGHPESLLTAYETRKYLYLPPIGRTGFLDDESTVRIHEPSR